MNNSTQPPPKFDSDLNTHKRFGVLLFIALFGFGGIWASTAPIDGAALAPGNVTVRSYSKVVQHLEGGIIDEIFVENGAKVTEGDPILNIDSTQPLAQLEIANNEYIALRALEVRLVAERDELESLGYPSEFLALGGRAEEETAAQIEIFNARRSAFNASIEVLEQRIEQLRSQIIGLKALKDSKDELAISFQEELEDIQALLDQGFADKNRSRSLERNVASFRGEAAELLASIASTEVQIGETRLQIIQQEREFQNSVVTELSGVQTNVSAVVERVTALEDIVSRTVVRAPESGLVNGLQVHTIGGVIMPGMRIVDIVPQEDDLIIEAEVAPVDIDRVEVGQNATIRFSTFGMGTVPTMYGEVINISADSMINEATNIPYYLARVEVSPDSLSELEDLTLMPGMPAEVFIATGERTFLEYLFKPFSNAIARGLRED
ncbi:HlyD family type I secretion periplasmic adaptor subunit [Gammaproteobacteria bacterium]|nr:HlyD family type I secretion periplasmic adaptor subunit [Gammaproteobacteria bacterium]